MKQRYGFVDQLRGLAAIFVLVSHYGFFYWLRPDYVQVLAHLPSDYLATASDFTAKITHISTVMNFLGIDFGVIGVGLFFLISGFVITLSLEYYQPAEFLVARIFRIYPSYWFSLLIMCFSVFWFSGFHYPLGGILSNALLLHDWLGDSTIDDVNWSLLIELKFYLLSAGAAALQKLNTRFLIVLISSVSFSLLLVVFYFQACLQQYPDLQQIINTCTYSGLFILYMQIGVRYAAYCQDSISQRILIFDLGIISLLFISCCLMQPIFNSKIILTGYSIALAIFFSFALSAKQIKLPWLKYLLNFFANISYSLYLLHAVIGYLIITIFLQHHTMPLSAILLTSILMVTLSWLTHHFIEKPSQAWGKKIFKTAH